MKVNTIYLKSFYKLGIVYLVINTLLRLVLLLSSIKNINPSVLDTVKLVLLGVINDIASYIICFGLIFLYLLFISNTKLKKPWGYIISVGLIVLWLYIAFFDNIFKQYGGSDIIPLILSLLGIKIICFNLVLLLSKKRAKVRGIIFTGIVMLFMIALIINTISEYLFWEEFGVRYNFIAVDYLIYTNEVIGNIKESYPIIPIIIGIIILAVLFTYLFFKSTKLDFNIFPNLQTKAVSLVGCIAFAFLAVGVLHFTMKFENNSNTYVNELQASGPFKFYRAFKDSKLDYDEYYKKLDNTDQVQRLLQEQYLASNNEQENRAGVENKKNIVLISIESLSASFLKRYGNNQNLTPNLDSLIDESLSFDNLFATGNRTVRGLEALSLSIPPSPGESVIKQEDNKKYNSIAELLNKKGYISQFMYGGNAYFDNMQDFFGGNGYEIIDKSSFSPEEITYQNVWG